VKVKVRYFNKTSCYMHPLRGNGILIGQIVIERLFKEARLKLNQISGVFELRVSRVRGRR